MCGPSESYLSGVADSWQVRREFLRRVIRSLVLDLPVDDYSDIIQQTLIEAHQKQLSGQAPVDPCHYRNWLRRILVCNMKDELRRGASQKRDRHKEVRFISGEESGQRFPALCQLIADIDSPSETFSEKERSWKIRNAIERLPDPNQRVIRMRFFQGMSTTEIAESIGRTDRAVAGLLYRSLLRLKQNLQEL